MLAAIEVYNKPQMFYRIECFSVLLVNAWELLLKAVLSKNKQRIFYPKESGQPYRTLTLQDTAEQAKPFFPPEISYEPVVQNIKVLTNYRNNSIHYYNQKGFDVIIYGLAQTSIINYRDLLLSIFKIDVANQMNINLLPLSFGTQPDPIQFLQHSKNNPPKSKEIAQFLAEISNIAQYLDARNLDLGRFLTVFKVNIQSVKKISAADFVVGVQSTADSMTPVYIERRIDPNVSHPESQTNVLEALGGNVNSVKFGAFQFQAIIWKYDVRNKPHLCWRSNNGALTRYSLEIISFIKKLSQQEIEDAIKDYREEIRRRQKKLHIK
jgi:hypothetical protein